MFRILSIAVLGWVAVMAPAMAAEPAIGQMAPALEATELNGQPFNLAAARGKVIVVNGRVSSVQRDGPTSVGTLTTGSETIYFVTPFSTAALAGDTPARFQGVFVQKYAPPGQPPALVIVGAFGPGPASDRSRP